MVITTNELKLKYQSYSDIYGKIRREIEKENLFPIVKGLYETNKNISGLYITAFIYGPSYVSFEYALSYHSLIPEKVYTYTNATFNKRKRKSYSNYFGNFTYRDVPNDAYPHFIDSYIVESYSYFIASPEKAICDMLYISSPQRSIIQLKNLLFEDLRVNREEFKLLNFENILFLTNKYKSTNLRLLQQLIESEYQKDVKKDDRKL